MPTKILIVQAPNFTPTAPAWNGAVTAELSKIPAILKTEIPPGGSALLLAPESLRKDSQMQGLLDAGYPLTCLFFRDQAQADAFSPQTEFLLAEGRTTGVKACLAKGSTIYSETFFDAGKVGERLDPVFRFARGKLSPQKSVEAWGTLQSLLFLGIRSLPEQGETGTGERVDVQVGADADHLVFSVRFDLPPEKWLEIRKHALLELPRSAVDFFEFRYLQSGKKAEFTAFSFFKDSPASTIEAQSFHPTAALENSQEVKEYNFQSFGSLGGKAPETKRVIKGGFKKKFSEQVKIAADPAAAEEKTVIKATSEKIVDADNGNFLVSGEVLQPAAKVVVSGAAGLGKGEVKTELKAAVAAEKSQSLMESKIQGLEATLKQREELVAKLNKEIEEIKDPSKMGVISGIKDNQVTGLKDNLTRLQAELVEAQGREKELLAVVDKAIQMKDEAVKRFKELDVKLKQSSGGNNSKVVMLDKQLEEQKRQNKELSKRITQLTDQLTAAGKRVA